MYLAYLVLSFLLTAYVARTLFRNGHVFLDDALGDERLAGSVNRLLVVGFWLLNLGYVGLAIRVSSDISTASSAVENLSIKLGLVLLVLGTMHFANLFVLSRFRRRRSRPGRSPARPRRPDDRAADPVADRALRRPVRAVPNRPALARQETPARTPGFPAGRLPAGPGALSGAGPRADRTRDHRRGRHGGGVRRRCRLADVLVGAVRVPGDGDQPRPARAAPAGAADGRRRCRGTAQDPGRRLRSSM